MYYSNIYAIYSTKKGDTIMSIPIKPARMSSGRRSCRTFIPVISIVLSLLLGLASAGCMKNSIENTVDGTGEDNNLSSAADAGGTGRADTAGTVAADAVYFSSQELEFYEAADNQGVQVISVTPSQDGVCMLIGVTTDTSEEESTRSVMEYTTNYFLLFYDASGKLVIQKDLSEVFDTSANNICCASGDTDGNVCVVTNNQEAAAAVDSPEDALEYQIYTFGVTGEMKGNSIPVSLDGGSPTNMAVDTEGNYFLGAGGIISVFDRSGDLLYDVNKEGLSGNLFLIGDTVYAESDIYNEEKGGNFECLLYPLDNGAQELGTPVDLSEYFPTGGPQIYAEADGISYTSGSGIETVNIETKEKHSLLQWKDLDIVRTEDTGNRMAVLSQDRILMANISYSENPSGEVSLILLSRMEKNPNVGKQIITVGGMGISSDNMIQSAVYDFNKKSTEYQIEIRDYYAEATDNGLDEYMTLQSAMNLDILAGDGPDIIVGSADLLSIYADKGCLTDFNELMAADVDFNKDDYLANIFKICETDGKLYQICTEFAIDGLVGSASVVGDRKGWTMEEFAAMADSLPEGMRVLNKSNTLQWVRLSSLFVASHDAFVNYSTGQVNFNSELFTQLLACAKEYGLSEAEMEAGGSFVSNASDILIQNGELALKEFHISKAADYARETAVFTGPVSVTGYPSADGSSALCAPDALWAISSVSGSEPGCWEFVKYMLGADVQETSDQIPVLRTAFEAQIEAAMIVKDAGDPTLINAATMTEEEAQAYRNLVDGLDSLSIYDSELFAVVREEAAAYFADQKSAQEVAALIQNRAQVLMDERQ